VIWCIWLNDGKTICTYNTVLKALIIRACERRGKRSGAGRKSGEVRECGAGVAENGGVGAEHGAEGHRAGLQK